MKKFKITYTTTREFEVPDNCLDEQYDELKAMCLFGLAKEPIKPDNITVELVTTTRPKIHFTNTIRIDTTYAD